jgi:hypothetical protein
MCLFRLTALWGAGPSAACDPIVAVVALNQAPPTTQRAMLRSVEPSSADPSAASETAALSQRVQRLLGLVPRDPQQSLPGGASDAQLADLAARLGLSLPPVLTAWLRMCNGAAIGPGGLFGARPDNASFDLAERSALYPQWRAVGWLPIAGDGCGNDYVLITTGRLVGFIAFIETMADPDRLDYLVASDLWRFLVFLLERELGDRRWPFDATAVLQADPRLADGPNDLMPWQTS